MRPRPTRWLPVVLSLMFTLAGGAGLAVTVAAGARGAPAPGFPVTRSAAAARAGGLLDGLPLAFTEDVPAAPGGPTYRSAGNGYSVILGGDAGARLALSGGPGRRPAALGIRPVGAGLNPTPRAEAVSPQPGRTSSFLGSDPAGWRAGMTAWGQVRFASIYPGIDVVYHGQRRNLEYDFVVAPRADPGAIALETEGANRVRIDAGGDLVLEAGGLEARMHRPVIYEEVGGARRPVGGGYVLDGPNRVGFRVGPYDRDVPLVIDPVLVNSSFLGGSSTDWAYGIATDGESNVYVVGYTESSDFPVAAAVQANLVQSGNVRTDAFVAKVNRDGNGLVYATYLGGNGNDTAFGVAVGPDGSAYVAGRTASTDFPTVKPFQKALGGGPNDAFVVKLAPDGSSMTYSTYLGGKGDDGAKAVAVDHDGSAYVAGATSSSNFPTVKAVRGAASHPDDVDAFVTKLAPTGGSIVYSTYLGGGGDDHGVGVAVDGNGNAYVTGDTRSTDFPVVRALQAQLGGPAGASGGNLADAFVTKLNATGSTIAYSTYLGGRDSEQAAGIAVDGKGSAYITGNTGSTDLPVVNAFQAKKNGDFDAFVAKVNTSGSVLEYSTYLGGSGSDGGAAIAVDPSGRAFVTGATVSTDFPSQAPFQATKGGGFVDGFVTALDPSGSALSWSSYMGGRDEDQGTAIAVGPDGNAVVTGYTNSADFMTAHPFQPAKAGGVGDAFVATVGDKAATAAPSGAVGAPGSSSARDKRIRVLLGLTVALLTAALLHTMWLRRRPPAEPDWTGKTVGGAVPPPAPARPAVTSPSRPREAPRREREAPGGKREAPRREREEAEANRPPAPSRLGPSRGTASRAPVPPTRSSSGELLRPEPVAADDEFERLVDDPIAVPDLLPDDDRTEAWAEAPVTDEQWAPPSRSRRGDRGRGAGARSGAGGADAGRDAGKLPVPDLAPEPDVAPWARAAGGGDDDLEIADLLASGPSRRAPRPAEAVAADDDFELLVGGTAAPDLRPPDVPTEPPPVAPAPAEAPAAALPAEAPAAGGDDHLVMELLAAEFADVEVEPDPAPPPAPQPPAGPEPAPAARPDPQDRMTRAADLSIQDLLAEDLPIPEPEGEQDMSMSELLAEDLPVAEPPEEVQPPAPPEAGMGPSEGIVE